MKWTNHIREWLAVALLAAGVALFFSSVLLNRSSSDVSGAARRASRVLNHRAAQLDGFAARALSQAPGEWIELEDLPDDFVVYRYEEDTLQSWVHEFPVSNDNINQRVYVPFLADTRFNTESPLLQVGDSLGFHNLGSRWYLAKSYREGSMLVIAGMEVVDDLPMFGAVLVNRHLHIPMKYAIRPISTTGGAAVQVQGRPQFKLIRESVMAPDRDASPLVWVALLLVLAALVVWLSASRTLQRFRWVTAVTLLVMGGLYFWGRFARSQALIFSPMLYAGGELLYSLGAVILINLTILMLSVYAYMIRGSIREQLSTRSRRIGAAAAGLALVAGIFAYSLVALHSIILNSEISLEIYKFSQLSPYTVIVYLSFISLLLSIPLLLLPLRPVTDALTGGRFDVFSLAGRVIYACLVGAFLVTTAAVLGFRKEQDRMELLANRLAFDRDISLELQLRMIESQIADDMVLSALSHFEGMEQSILSRVSNYYFSVNAREYQLSVQIFNEFNDNRQSAAEFNAVLQDGVPISDNSHFLYVKRETGRFYYVGLFFYLSDEGAVSRMLIRLDPRAARGSRGYAGIFGSSSPGQVNLPSGYSYASYEGRELKANKGRYPYPTRLDERRYVQLYSAPRGHVRMEGYTHFVNVVGDEEAIVLSRESIALSAYLVAVLLLSLLTFMMLSLIRMRQPREYFFNQSYFRTRISWVLLISLVLTMLAMGLVSIVFVYSRNDSNRQSVMSDRISSIVAMLEPDLQRFDAGSGVRWPMLRAMVERISNETGSDLTLYSADGRLLMTTTQDFFGQRMLATRIDGTAYYNITYLNRRHYIQQERQGPQRFYSMYAPLFAGDNTLVAILSSPYNEDTYDFEEDAVMHSMAILSLFVLFLMLALFMVSRIVDRMFRPLSEMSQKMASADLGSLEYIQYDRDDEISTIVQAYNRMVTELSESTVKLAQAERDKAWSGMARQVAHEIKNPLTPMKLQLQRVIRLKQKGDPAWQGRFEEASQIILDHIDILTDTANEFSTFAKLYTEPSTDIALDRLLQEEISMFDNRENIHFDYLGLDDVVVQGPKPQLTRVFVNLLGNAVQAIGEQPDGRIMVSLRKSSEAGFYDIVVEDNGPGVAEENVDKLFTPNFTTKNAGSGLGLAISRSILDRCGATISYSRSFTLGGACFSVHYPASSEA